MAKEGWTQVILKNELAEKLKQKSPKNIQLSTYVQSILQDMIETEQAIRDFAPLQFVNAMDSSVFLKDRVKGRVIELIVKDSKLFCQLDESDDCIHVGFAWAIPAIYKVMKDHSGKKPLR